MVPSSPSDCLSLVLTSSCRVHSSGNHVKAHGFHDCLHSGDLECSLRLSLPDLPPKSHALRIKALWTTSSENFKWVFFAPKPLIPVVPSQINSIITHPRAQARTLGTSLSPLPLQPITKFTRWFFPQKSCPALFSVPTTTLTCLTPLSTPGSPHLQSWPHFTPSPQNDFIKLQFWLCHYPAFLNLHSKDDCTVHSVYKSTFPLDSKFFRGKYCLFPFLIP